MTIQRPVWFYVFQPMQRGGSTRRSRRPGLNIECLCGARQPDTDIEIYSMSVPGENLHLTSYMFQGPALVCPTRGEVKLMGARRQPDNNSEMAVAMKSVGWGCGTHVTTPLAIPLAITVQ
jgi:hypothetical protein